MNILGAMQRLATEFLGRDPDAVADPLSSWMRRNTSTLFNEAG